MISVCATFFLPPAGLYTFATLTQQLRTHWTTFVSPLYTCVPLFNSFRGEEQCRTVITLTNNTDSDQSLRQCFFHLNPSAGVCSTPNTSCHENTLHRSIHSVAQTVDVVAEGKRPTVQEALGERMTMMLAPVLESQAKYSFEEDGIEIHCCAKTDCGGSPTSPIPTVCIGPVTR